MISSQTLVLELIERTEKRRDSFMIVKEHLDTVQSPMIIETGCVRADDDFKGAGSSTLIWDCYVTELDGNYLSVDNDIGNVNFAKSRVKRPTSIIWNDSVAFLEMYAGLVAANLLPKIDVLYLDSLDSSPGQEHDAALHHMFELMAAKSIIKSGGLLMVDDNDGDNGKGKYIKQYMDHLNLPIRYQGYQYIWSM